MSRTIALDNDETDCAADPARVQRVIEAARRFIAYRERLATIISGRLPRPASLAEAIDRDFLHFDITQSERELRAAVIALDPDSAPVWLACPEVRARHAKPGWGAPQPCDNRHHTNQKR